MKLYRDKVSGWHLELGRLFIDADDFWWFGWKPYVLDEGGSEPKLLVWNLGYVSLYWELRA